MDFETTIFVKKNAGKLFKSWLARPGYEAEQVTLSGITDCYQPIERTLKITRDCLQIARETLHPTSIITKNRLVSRDIDLLAEMAIHHICRVCLSINSLDQSLTRIMEPACSAPAARISAVRELAQAGIPVHLMVAPVVPGLNDHEIPAVLAAAASAGATSASFIVLRLPQVVEEIFLDWLAQKQPEKRDVVISRLKRVRGGRLTSSEFGKRMRGEGQIADQIRQLFEISARKCGLTTKPEPLRTDLFVAPDAVDGQMRLF